MADQVEWAELFAHEAEVLTGQDLLSYLDVLDVLATCGLKFVEAEGLESSIAYQDAVAEERRIQGE